ncbi:tetratricopeptide repeat protein [Amycolatopsis echigonensis]|uniref:Tetratricopeptide repeat protein n=1 Tax=Amycolatopsis echigonensis TaxID=2576905 RepID=A0A2N3WK79_9PSEU|nr:tetratricopeptide repeat protein [Amycolatopsis niigatensis]PKV94266.1 tetratricopeptide repeat protein [Amycolatopsis niigatensis]
MTDAEESSVNRISGGQFDKVVMAGAVHGDINVGRSGDSPADLADPLIASVRLKPGGTLADLVLDTDPPQVAVPGGTVHIITVEARTNRAVVLQSARVVVVSRTPPRPACLQVRIGGLLEPRPFTTDFDAPSPRLVAQGPDFPFTVSATDIEQFEIEPVTTTHEVAWRLEVDWTCAGRHGTTVIDNQGEPFHAYPVPALFSGRSPSVLSSGCDLFHERGCPANLLAASGAPASLWDREQPPPYPVLPPHSATETSELGLDPDLKESWPEYRRVAVAIRMSAAQPDFRSHEPPEYRALLIRVLRYLFVSGQAHPGVALGRLVHAEWTAELGEDHPDTLAVANRLAGCLIGTTDHAEARDLLAELLPRVSRVLGEDDPLTLTVANNLCVVYLRLNEYERAREQTEDVLARSRRALGPDALGTLRTTGNLVQIHLRLGDRASALAVLEDLLPRCRRALGEDHPQTVSAAAVLAQVLAEEG